MTEALIYTFGVNLLWQAALLAIGVAVVIKVFKITAPKYRALFWSAAFFASVLAPLSVFLPGAAIEAPVLASSVATTTPLAAPVSEVPIAAGDHGAVVISNIDVMMMLAALIWFAGALLCIAKLFAGAVSMTLLRRAADPVAPGEGLVPSSVTIRSHKDVIAPMATGIFRPMVILPVEMTRDLSAVATRNALAHELAHIKRGDLMANFVEQAILCLFWWNPVLHFMRAAIAENREMACDDHAVERMQDAGGYASAIIRCAERAIKNNQQRKRVHALSATGRPSAMAKRITRLLADNYSANQNLRAGSAMMASMVLALSAGLIVAATPRVALAQSSSETADPTLTDAQRLGQSLVEAIADDDRARAESLVAAGADIHAVLEGDGTPLIAAVNAEDMDVAAWLIALGADVDQYALYDETALISAVRTGNIDMVQLLINAGADVNLSAPTENNVIRSPMGEAKRLKHNDIAALLIASGASE